MKKRGFTLIELLAVIVILAIIAVIAVPTIMNIIVDETGIVGTDTIGFFSTSGGFVPGMPTIDYGVRPVIKISK